VLKVCFVLAVEVATAVEAVCAGLVGCISSCRWVCDRDLTGPCCLPLCYPFAFQERRRIASVTPTTLEARCLRLVRLNVSQCRCCRAKKWAKESSAKCGNARRPIQTFASRWYLAFSNVAIQSGSILNHLWHYIYGKTRTSLHHRQV